MDSETTRIVEEVKAEILAKKKASWPPNSIFAFIKGLPPATVGGFGAKLLSRALDQSGLTVSSGGTELYDLEVQSGGGFRIEVKCSTESPRRFQQVRDPRPNTGSRWRYDALVCVGVSPDDLTFWFIPSPSVAKLIDDKAIGVQHADSHTHWFFPDEKSPICPFRKYMVARKELVEKISKGKALGKVAATGS